MKTRWLVVLPFVLLPGCASFRPIGSNVVGGALDELEKRGGTAGLTRSAVVGAREELVNEESRQKLLALQTAMMQQMTLDAARLRQELLGDAFRADIERARAEFLDKSHQDLARLRADLFGPRTRDAAGTIADRVTGDITRENLGRLRDEILGEQSRLMAERLVQQTSLSMQREMIVMRYRLESEKVALQDELQRTAWLSGLFIAALGTVIVVLVIAARRRDRIIAALVQPIQGIADVRFYEDLSHRVLARARELGVVEWFRDRMGEREIQDDRGSDKAG
jgi:hypothetical protein